MLLTVSALVLLQGGADPQLDLPTDKQNRAEVCIAILDEAYAAVEAGHTGRYDAALLDGGLMFWTMVLGDGDHYENGRISLAAVAERERPEAMRATRVGWCMEPSPPFDTIDANRAS